MPKLAIYVPKKDMRIIEQWRKEINFSKVFMRALMEEIRERTRAAETDEGRLAAAAQYYRRRLAEQGNPLLDFGFKLGVRQVMQCRLSPEMIHQLLELNDQESWQPKQVEAIEKAIGSAMGLVRQMLERHASGEAPKSTWRSIVYRGYVRGVASAWKRICEHM